MVNDSVRFCVNATAIYNKIGRSCQKTGIFIIKEIMCQKIVRCYKNIMVIKHAQQTAAKHQRKCSYS
jgi:hypothetical protein